MLVTGHSESSGRSVFRFLARACVIVPPTVQNLKIGQLRENIKFMYLETNFCKQYILIMSTFLPNPLVTDTSIEISNENRRIQEE